MDIDAAARRVAEVAEACAQRPTAMGAREGHQGAAVVAAQEETMRSIDVMNPPGFALMLGILVALAWARWC